MNAFTQALIKSGQSFNEIVEPVLVYKSKSSGFIRNYTFLELSKDNTVITMFHESIESIVATMQRSEEYIDIQILGYAEYAVIESAATAEHYKVGIPKQISKARFWEMLEVLPPEKWERFNGAEAFRMMEALSEDLHSYFLRIGKNYFEIVNPRKCDYAVMLKACEALDLVEMPDEEVTA